MFRSVGSQVEMGYCFGVDFIVVYRLDLEGEQLLGNSSADSLTITLPPDLRGRISTSHQNQLLGLQIKNLTQRDSGTYRRECWRSHSLVNQHTQQLSVCDTEADSEQITVSEGEGETQITCNSSSIGKEGTTVRWYYEIYPSYRITQFMDSSMSLNPVEGVLEVKNSGASLVLDKSMLSNNQHFYCLVSKGAHCLSFQNLYLPERLESRDIFVSLGDNVKLFCEADGSDQHWETPSGQIVSSEDNEDRSHHMFVSTGNHYDHFSLVIFPVSKEHIGEYSCISSSSELQYSLVQCTKKRGQEKFVFETEEVTLHCDIGQEDSYIVQWYRKEASGQQELIYDSGDESVPIPEDLRGRVNVSEDGLTLSHVERKDEGMYWCVLLKGMVFLEPEDEDYDDEVLPEDEEEGEEGQEEGTDDPWIEEDRCIFKQETYLCVRSKTSEGDKNISLSPTKQSLRKLPIPTSKGEAYTGTRVGVMLVTVIAVLYVV